MKYTDIYIICICIYTYTCIMYLHIHICCICVHTLTNLRERIPLHSQDYPQTLDSPLLRVLGTGIISAQHYAWLLILLLLGLASK